MFSAAAYRERFPLLRHTIHLGNCSQAPLSTDVVDAMHSYERSLLEVGMDWLSWMGMVDQAREAFALLIGADARDVGVMSCVSDTISAVASCLPIRGRRRVVTTVDEFPTVGHGWLARANHDASIEVSFVRASDGFYTADVVAPHLNAETALLSTHLVSYYSAALQDVHALAEIAHQAGALLLVDAYQGLGTVPFNVRESNADIVVSGTLKYLLGIPGIAFIYVRPELSAELQPAMTGWFGRIDPFNFDATRLDYAAGARRFDMGTPSIVAAYAARAGIQLVQEVGIHLIAQHVQDLSQQVIDGALQRGLQVASPLDVTRKGAATAIRVGKQSHDIEAALLRRHIIVAARADVIRIAPHFFTLPADIECALDALVGL
jgi:selenocysteine lyase/cysteine desulfurase